MVPPAVVVCYRPERTCDRPAQLAQLLQRLHDLAPAAPVYVIEQSDDGRRFNRGALLNYGTRLALDDGARGVILHDCDLLPSDDLGQYYRDAQNLARSPVHIAAAYERYKSEHFFGGVVGLSRAHILRVNGFPNRFWGWGGEDQALRERCLRLDLRPVAARGTIKDLEVGDDGAPLTLSAKLARLDAANAKCPVKREHLRDEARAWPIDGLNAVRPASVAVVAAHSTPMAHLHVVVQLPAAFTEWERHVVAQACHTAGCVPSGIVKQSSMAVVKTNAK
jgi:hypothetical protein